MLASNHLTMCWLAGQVKVTCKEVACEQYACGHFRRLSLE